MKYLNRAGSKFPPHGKRGKTMTRLMSRYASKLLATGNYKAVYDEYISIVKSMSKARMMTPDEALETERAMWRLYCDVAF